MSDSDGEDGDDGETPDVRMHTDVEIVPLESINPYEQNPQDHPPKQIADLKKSILSGWDQPIVVDEERVIIKGHGRRLAALDLGLDRVPIMVRDDLSPEEVRAARIADNKTAFDSIWNYDNLQIELSELADVDDLAVDTTGFTSDEVDEMIEQGLYDIDEFFEEVDPTPPSETQDEDDEATDHPEELPDADHSPDRKRVEGVRVIPSTVPSDESNGSDGDSEAATAGDSSGDSSADSEDGTTDLDEDAPSADADDSGERAELLAVRCPECGDEFEISVVDPPTDADEAGAAQAPTEAVLEGSSDDRQDDSDGDDEDGSNEDEDS